MGEKDMQEEMKKRREGMRANRDGMGQRQRMMRRMSGEGMNLEGLKVENGKIVKEVTSEELDFMKERMQNQLDNLTSNITNKEREIEETKTKIKEMETKFKELDELILKTKEKK